MKKNLLHSLASLLLLCSLPVLSLAQDQGLDAKATAVSPVAGESTTGQVAQEAIDEDQFRTNKISSKAKIVFQDYSWKLNEAR
jgi:hypothetical protein